MKQRVLLGMSGGTDSSVAAMLLLKQGYDVTGITFRFWDGSEKQHLQDAVRLAEQLKIEHVVFDARDLFEKKVIRYFVKEYLDGRTPFPCAKCNNELKWNLIFQEADRIGCDKVAMGHYVNILYDNGFYYITEGVDKDKDQSFFLWGLKQEQLKRIFFPLGNLCKSEVRSYAEKKGFKTLAVKKDSTGVCFCPGDYHSFLYSQLSSPGEHIQPGNFVDETGVILGQHKGYPLYTVGQRRGLGIHLNRAVFVKEIRPSENEVVLAPLQSLYRSEFVVNNYQLVNRALFSSEFNIVTRIRYRKQKTLSRVIFINDDYLKVELLEPLESIAPGQSAVFYQGEKVLGGGFIV